MHCFHRIFKFGLQSSNRFLFKHVKLFGNKISCKDVQELNIHEKSIPLDTF